jgi:protein-S-isoprenylcysteine O-methyltransferase Ste14
MNIPSLSQIELIPWYAILVYFVVASARVKQDRTEEALTSRAVHIGLGILGSLFLFTSRFQSGILGQHFVPESRWLQAYGTLLTFAGAAITIWARYALGEYWSSRITVKEDHQLIRSGPYALVRHPIYTGILVAAAGRALFVGEWCAVVGFCFFLATFVYKARKEEAWMNAEFGDRYQSYRQQTGFLIPRFY